MEAEKGNTVYESTISTESALFQLEMTLRMSKSRMTTKHKSGEKLPPIPPGEVLRSEFMEPLNLSANKLALHMGVPATRVTAILNENRTITADTAVRLSRVFTTSTEFWLNLQSNYEIAMLDYTGEKDKICSETRQLA
jgi:antitoxin HigA-1